MPVDKYDRKGFIWVRTSPSHQNSRTAIQSHRWSQKRNLCAQVYNKAIQGNLRDLQFQLVFLLSPRLGTDPPEILLIVSTSWSGSQPYIPFSIKCAPPDYRSLECSKVGGSCIARGIGIHPFRGALSYTHYSYALCSVCKTCSRTLAWRRWDFSGHPRCPRVGKSRVVGRCTRRARIESQ